MYSCRDIQIGFVFAFILFTYISMLFMQAKPNNRYATIAGIGMTATGIAMMIAPLPASDAVALIAVRRRCDYL
jgi:hypothetical protein